MIQTMNIILNIGVDQMLSQQAVKRIRLVNGAALISGSILVLISIMVAAFLSPPFFIDFTMWREIFFSLPTEWNSNIDSFVMHIDFYFGIISFIAIFLNYRKKYNAAAISLSVLAIVVSASYYFILNILIYYIFFIPGIFPLVLFDKKKYYLTLIILNYLVFIVSTWLIFHYSIITKTYNIYAGQDIILNFTAGYLLLLLIIGYFKKENNANEKKLERQYGLLEIQTNEIRRQHDEIWKEKKILQDYQSKILLELSLAQKIQNQMIPAKSFNKSLSFFYKPMDEVGGDFFDIFVTQVDKTISIFISDVSGHGVPAAFITSMIKTSIYQSEDARKDPAKLLSYLNDILVNQTAGNFVTAFYCIYDPTKREIMYANAGHNYPFLIENESVSELYGGSMPLAILNNIEMSENNKTYKNYSRILPEKSRLVFYTDGLTEAFHKHDTNCYFEDILKNDLLLSLKSQTCEDFISMTFEKLKNFHGKENFDDDICLICLDVA